MCSRWSARTDKYLPRLNRSVLNVSAAHGLSFKKWTLARVLAAQEFAGIEDQSFEFWSGFLSVTMILLAATGMER